MRRSMGRWGATFCFVDGVETLRDSLASEKGEVGAWPPRGARAAPIAGSWLEVPVYFCRGR